MSAEAHRDPLSLAQASSSAAEVAQSGDASTSDQTADGEENLEVTLRKARIQKKRDEEDADTQEQDLAAQRQNIVAKQAADRQELLDKHSKKLADQREGDNNKQESIKADLKSAEAKVEHWQESLKDEAFATGRWTRIKNTHDGTATYQYEVGLSDSAGFKLPEEHQKDTAKFQGQVKFGSAGKLISFTPDALATVKKDLATSLGSCGQTKVQSCHAPPGKTVWMYRWTVEATDEAQGHMLNTGHFRCHVTDGAEKEPECPFGFCGNENELCESSKCKEWRDQTAPLDSNAQEKHKEMQLEEAKLEVAKMVQTEKDHKNEIEQGLQQLKDDQAKEQAEQRKAQDSELVDFDAKRDEELKKAKDKVLEDEKKIAELEQKIVTSGEEATKALEANEKKARDEARLAAEALERAKAAQEATKDRLSAMSEADRARDLERKKEVFALAGHWETREGILELVVDEDAANGKAIAQDGMQANLTFPASGKVVMHARGLRYFTIEGKVKDLDHIEWTDDDKWTRENYESELHYNDFTVHMRKKKSQHWGISLWKHKKDGMLTVKDIGEVGKHGVIPEQNEWFLRHNMVNRQLRVGDELVKINCKSDVHGMLEEMRTQDHLKIVVRREPLQPESGEEVF